MHSFTALFIVLVASVFRLAEASSGCDLSSTPWKFDKTGHSNRTLGDRSFWVHLPSTYKPDVPHPVVLSYHGSNSSSRRQEYISGFSQHGLTINKTGIIAVYPMAAYGPGKHGDEAITAWEGAPYAPPGVDDVSFTLNIIQALKDNLCVDPNRIYAAGKSEGGGFVNLLACTNTTASVIAAYAPVSAALYNGSLPFEGCDPGSRTIPLINFHGLADTIVPYGGQQEELHNTSYALPNITVWRETWATRNGCNSAKTAEVTNITEMKAYRYVWDCSLEDAQAVVHGYSVIGLRHSWPSTKGLNGQRTTFNATNQFIVPFFNEYALNNSFSYPPSNNSGTHHHHHHSGAAAHKFTSNVFALSFLLSCGLAFTLLEFI